MGQDRPTGRKLLGCVLGFVDVGLIVRLGPLAIAAAIHLMALAALLPGAVWAWPQARLSAPALGAAAVLGVVTSGLAYWMFLRVMRHVSPVAAASTAFMIPVFGVALGALFLDEPLGPGIWAGGALILLATALVTGLRQR